MFQVSNKKYCRRKLGWTFYSILAMPSAVSKMPLSPLSFEDFTKFFCLGQPLPHQLEILEQDPIGDLNLASLR